MRHIPNPAESPSGMDAADNHQARNLELQKLVFGADGSPDQIRVASVLSPELAEKALAHLTSLDRAAAARFIADNWKSAEDFSRWLDQNRQPPAQCNNLHAVTLPSLKGLPEASDEKGDSIARKIKELTEGHIADGQAVERYKAQKERSAREMGEAIYHYLKDLRWSDRGSALTAYCAAFHESFTISPASMVKTYTAGDDGTRYGVFAELHWSEKGPLASGKLAYLEDSGEWRESMTPRQDYTRWFSRDLGLRFACGKLAADGVTLEQVQRAFREVTSKLVDSGAS